MLSRLVFLGPPGAGKGTQTAIIREKMPTVPYVATGAIFREAISKETTLGKEIAQFVNSGLLVPDKLTNAIVVERLKQKDCVKGGFILDGYPRSLTQAKALDLYLKKAGTPLERVIYFKAETQLVIERMSQRRICSRCGATFNLISQPPKKSGVCDRCSGELITRTDDFPESTVRKRLKIYEETTSPLLAYYEERKVLSVVNAAQPVDVIAREVAAICGLG